MRRYRLYLDETGDHTFTNANDPKKRYLGLTGVIIESESYKAKFHPNLETLKQKYFPHSPDEPVILHRDDIIKKRGPFWRLRDETVREEFGKEFLTFIGTERFALITVVIDKFSHHDKYGAAAFHPYHYCLTVMLERFCGYLEFNRGQGDVLAESRGCREDTELNGAYQKVYHRGTFYRASGFFQNVLTTKDVKFKSKQANIAGLQVADLLAHASKVDVLNRNKVPIGEAHKFEVELIQRIQSKYNCQIYDGRIAGYGRILLK